MLSRNNKILVGCLALLLVMSVGYALFSDTITVNGTATAKGEFDITATCQTGIPSEFGTPESLGLDAEGGYQNDTCSVVDDTVSLSTDLLYPGARRYFTVKYTNTGTIDATANELDITASKQMCVADNLEGENQTCNTSTSFSSVLDIKGYRSSMEFDFIGMENAEGNLLTINEVTEFIDFTTDTITLKPGYSVYYYNSLWVDHSPYSNYTTNKMFVEFSATANIPFKQAQ